MHEVSIYVRLVTVGKSTTTSASPPPEVVVIAGTAIGFKDAVGGFVCPTLGVDCRGSGARRAADSGGPARAALWKF